MTSTDLVQGADGETASDSGDLLVWILAWSELAAFGALLTAYVVASWIHPDEFAKGAATLHQTIALANTIILLTSGWFAVKAANCANQRSQRLTLLAAAGGGFLFVALKLYEYRLEGASLLAADTFSQLYLLITGFHMAHVLFGSLLLVLVARFPSPQNVHLMTTLWHVIDIVWLVMLPVVYLL
ncbi:cytochrome c oxidase subunit 3 [Rhizobium leguminosarum]|uniref:cytochrome c oxidase subunit 3 n=1 Tax=Rhizobium leguminosarum TaxID=384 RepID=UPI001AEA7B15|nr:cytochrome c oxidase subunit 3 [Rhizobium leguminosarum]MBP2445079.1 nitric oxide reductase NorE protein [Rhizobium leguminosarum]